MAYEIKLSFLLLTLSIAQSTCMMSYEINNQNEESISLHGFSFKDCGGKFGTFYSLSIAPDPLKFPGILTLGFNVTLRAMLDSPLKATLTTYFHSREYGLRSSTTFLRAECTRLSILLEKEIAGKYRKIPCKNGIGSCVYKDLCEMLKLVEVCPIELQKADIPCQCPYEAGKDILPSVEVYVDSGQYSPGNYHVQGNITTLNSKPAICLEMYLSVR